MHFYPMANYSSITIRVFLTPWLQALDLGVKSLSPHEHVGMDTTDQYLLHWYSAAINK